MRQIRRGLLSGLLFVIAGLAVWMHALIRKTSAPEAPSPPRLPAHFESAEAGRPFPATLPPESFDDPVTVKAYAVARRLPEVLVQQPCYCWCEGHGSLLGCHATRHADD
jgi:hypothetical protein